MKTHILIREPSSNHRSKRHCKTSEMFLIRKPCSFLSNLVKNMRLILYTTDQVDVFFSPGLPYIINSHNLIVMTDSYAKNFAIDKLIDVSKTLNVINTCLFVK